MLRNGDEKFHETRNNINNEWGLEQKTLEINYNNFYKILFTLNFMIKYQNDFDKDLKIVYESDEMKISYYNPSEEEGPRNYGVLFGNYFFIFSISEFEKIANVSKENLISKLKEERIDFLEAVKESKLTMEVLYLAFKEANKKKPFHFDRFRNVNLKK